MDERRLTRHIALAAAGALLIAGCTADEPEETVTTVDPTPTESTTVMPTPPTQTLTPEPSPTETVTAQPDPAPDDDPPTEEAPFPADRAPDTSDTSDDARLSPIDLRFGVHDGYDRVVLDLDGEGEAGWLSEYVDDPRHAGSGEPVDIAGAVTLHTSVRGVIYPTEDDAADYDGPQRFSPESGGVIEEVVYGSIYEAQLELYIGLSSQEPFRVFWLDSPPRVVIDVQHP